MVAPATRRVRLVHFPHWVFDCKLATTAFDTSLISSEIFVCSQVYAGHSVPRQVLAHLRMESVPYPGMVPAGLAVGASVEEDQRVLYEGTAWAIAKAELLQQQASVAPDVPLRVEFEYIRSRMVTFPAAVVEYEEFGRTHAAYVCGTTGRVFGMQQLVFPAPVYASMVATINAFDWRSLRSHAKLTVQLARSLKRYGRYLILPPLLIATVVATALSPIWHAYGITSAAKALETAWQAQVKAEVASQRLDYDNWSFRFGSGRDHGIVVPVTPAEQQRRTAAAMLQLQNIPGGIPALVESVLQDADDSHALKHAAALAHCYDALGMMELGPRADAASIRKHFRREMARATAEGRSADASTLRSVYSALCDMHSRAVIDEVWFSTKLV